MMVNENKALAEISQAEQALQRADNIQDIVTLRDKAASLQLFANAQGFREAAQKAKIFQLKAERRAGEWLDQNIQNGGKPESHDVTLVDIGVTKMESQRWQQEASLPEEIFTEWVDTCLETGEEISASALRREAIKLKIAAEHSEKHSRPLPEGKFKVIYADPPWTYDNSGFNQSAASHYPTMTTEAICDLAIEKMTDETTTLFMWATSPLLPDAFRVIEAWGFDYKASMIWVKNHAPGIGWWVQTQHEILLIASNGPNHPIIKPPSVIIADNGRHSQKPEEFYEIIEHMYPGESKIELFARSTRDNWISWGNENV